MSNFISKESKKNSIALSFDVEDWFTVRNMRDFISDADWDKQELRVNIGMNFILDALEKKNIKSTFFVLGWIAERCPELLQRINDLGHEIGCHGYQHTPIDLMDPQSFALDLTKAVRSIESVIGKRPKGFRAPSFSITKKTAWALPIIKDCGFEYDSSIFATTHPDYGVHDFPTTVTNANGFLEVPLRKSLFFGTKIPVCGGGYFRMLPYKFTKSALEQDLNEGPVVMYFHPWEFDPGQPHMDLPLTKSFRHYVGLKSNRQKFTNLLNDFDFITMEQLVSASVTKGTIAEYNFNLEEVAQKASLARPQFAN